MATEAAAPEEGTEEPKKKKPILLILGAVVGATVIMVSVAFGTLYFSGFLREKSRTGRDGQIGRA